MRRLLMVLLMLSVAGTAMASVTGNISSITPKITVTPPQNPPDRPVGDTIADALVTGLGTVSGNSSSFTNDYDEMCPYSGSLSPDVVYAYTPAAGVQCIDISLCFSGYDTKVYVYHNTYTPSAPYACNDDYYFAAPCYTYSSAILGMAVTAGDTYYIVVDGYGSQYGAYQMDLTDCGIPPATGACCDAGGGCTVTTQPLCPGSWQGENTTCSPNPCPPPPPVVCPPGSLIEGEPTCQDGYTDNYNGGCNSTPVVWQALGPQGTTTCATMCGKSCTYVSGGLSNRDTDWYLSVAAGGLVNASCTAEFPLQFILFTATDCAGLAYIVGTGGPGVLVTMPPTNFAVNDDCGFWVGNQGFSGWPESNYTMNVCGIIPPPPPPGACCRNGLCLVMEPALCLFSGGIFQGDPVCLPNTCDVIPTESKSWGALKNLYR